MKIIINKFSKLQSFPNIIIEPSSGRGDLSQGVLFINDDDEYSLTNGVIKKTNELLTYTKVQLESRNQLMRRMTNGINSISNR